MTYIWKPPKELVDETNVKAYIDSRGFSSYKEFVKYSIDNPRKFWAEMIDALNIEFFKDYSEVLDVSKGVEWARWFIGGKVNVCYNVLDRHEDKLAFIWYGERGEEVRMSYSELKEKVSRLAGFFKERGVKKGDVIAAYIPMLPETIITLLATLKAGAVFSPIFSGFSPSAVAERLKDAEPKFLVTCDGYYRKGKIIELKREADEAINLSNKEINVLIVRRTGIEVEIKEGRDLYFDEALKSKRLEYCEETDAEDPALLLYTSGTTGKPKGSVITHIGALLQPSKEIYFNMDLKEDGKLLWISDIGWMMGPWQIIGSQNLHSSHIIFEGAIDYPEQDRIWKIISKSKVTAFGFAATVARILKRYGSKIAKENDLSSIRTFGNTGEPIDPDTWFWVMKEIGEEKRPIINLSGGTEIFGCFLLPSPIVELKPSTLWGPGLGMDVDVFDDEGNPVRNKVGYLVCKKPAPSMTKGFWKDEKRYIETYWSVFPGVWYHGDLAMIDEDGFWFLLGRADDTIKVAGKRIGPAEIEGAINKHYAVAESACIGAPEELKGEEIVCFVVLKRGFEEREELKNEIKEVVIKEVGKPFEPSKIYFVKDIPKTRSGKIMRRLIRNILLNKDLGDLTVLENPESLEEIKKKISR